MDDAELSHPSIYLDTNILVSYMHEREEASLNLIAEIRVKKWRCITSSFSSLEIYDVERLEAWAQSRRQRNWMYSQIIKNYSRRFNKTIGLTDDQLKSVFISIRDWLISFEDCIYFQRPNDEISINAERWCATTNIAAPDALHLATAIFTQCDILVTNDDDFLGIAKQNRTNTGIIATKAKNFTNALAEYLDSE